MVSAAEMMSIAAFVEGRHAQAFPSFGSERMGAPVTAFCRIDDKPIRSREPVMQPDAIIIQDPTLLHQLDVFSGLKDGGYILINSTRSFEELGLGELVAAFPPHHVRAIPASDIALAKIGRPLPNAALLGAFAAITGRLALDSVAAAIRTKFSGKVALANVAASRAAAEAAREGLGFEAAHA